MNSSRHSFIFRVGSARTVCALVMVLLLGIAVGCGKQEKKASAAPPSSVPVVIAQAEQKDVPITVTGIGTVEPFSTVQVKSMVGGQILKVHFTQGQDVRKGQLLFTIDRRPFEAALAQAKGALERDVAAAKNARVQATRYAALLKEGVVAQQQYDQMQSAADAAEASVAADKAAVQAAEVNLQYTLIYSPIDGRAGDLLVHEGNIIKSNDVALVTINQLMPIQASFTIPETNLGDVRKYMTAGSLKVQAMFPEQNAAPADGTLKFINNTVDPQTGTIELKATFANQDHRLWPGQFVNVVLTLTTEKNATVVPAQAVQSGQQGNYVYVVKADKTVESRIVQLGPKVGQNSLVIRTGVNAGEAVVTDGQLRLVPGAKVDARNANQQQSTIQQASAEQQPRS